MQPSSAKAKGRNLAKWTKSTILAVFTELLDDDIKVTSSGATGEDIQLSPKARALLPFSIECKNLAKIAVYKFYEQAESNSKGHMPLVVMKANHKAPLVVLSLEHFIRIMKEYNDYKKNRK